MTRRHLAAFALGLAFATGLCVSGMTQPAKIFAFLDFAGAWDPSLALVMGAAVGVYAALFPVIVRRRAPSLAASFSISIRHKRRLDGRLFSGAALFGVGWGLGGYCPGPAMTALGAGVGPAFIVTGGMLAGVVLHHVAHRARTV